MKKVQADPRWVADRGTYLTLREHALQLNALIEIFGTTLTEYADDAAAATGGIPIGGFYRTASAVKQRVA